MMVRMDKDRIAALAERIANLPEEAQAEIEQSVAEVEARYGGIYRLSPEERAGVQRGLEQVRRGEFASDEDVEALFSRFGA